MESGIANRFATTLRGLLACLVVLAGPPVSRIADAQPATPGPPQTPKRVFVLDSYHLGQTWTDSTLAGLREVFARSGLGVELSVEFMDVKRERVTEVYLSGLADLFSLKYRDTAFDLVVACGNDALDFLRARRDRLFPGVPMVFLALSFSEDMLDGRRDLTGVVESIDYLGTLQAALRLRPGTTTVVAVTDDSTAGRGQRAAVEKLAPRMPGGAALRFLSLGDTTLDDLGDQLSRLSSDSVVLLLNCTVDRSGRSYAVEAITPYLCSRSPVPVFVLSDGRLGMGVLGGVVTSGHAEGRVAAEMAVSILKGAAVTSIPVRTRGPSVPLFDDPVMRRFGITPRQLPEGSTILHRPPSILEQYRTLVLTTGAVFFTITASLVILGLEVLRRRRVEISLQKSEARLAGVLNSVPQGIFWKDTRSVYLGCNENFARAAGLAKPEEVVGKTDFDLPWTASEAQAYRADDAAVIERARAKRHIVEPLRQADGDVRWIDTSKIPLTDERGDIYGVLGVYEDVTDRRKSEEERARLVQQLQQAAKMEAVGRLAGGVAHDFNNLLTAISGNLELARSDLPADSRVDKYLQEVEKAAGSAASLTRQLLSFSRKQIIEPRVISLNDLVSRMNRMLVRLIGEDVSLRTLLAEDLGAVRVDPGQFEQVLVNLVMNGRDAMPQGGSLLIETANLDLDEHYCATHPHLMPGPFVLVAVTDTGCGMTDEVKSRVFEPFFTTKPKGRGTGLGLAMAFGTVKQAGGSIDVYSEVGRGTTVKIYLPRVAETPVAMADGTDSERPPGGRETVLLVEDDAGVRTWTLAVLKRLGYSVLHAASGSEALALAEGAGRIDLLMTDVVMPGMNGRELAERLIETYPKLRVLYTSGYTDNVIVHHGLVDEHLSFIGKPYSMRALAAKLREVLAARAG